MQSAKRKVRSLRVKATGALHFALCIFASAGFKAATAENTPPKFVGSASCATAACHGGLAGHKFVGSEFPIWSARDPHSRAYSVLLNDLSRQMAEQLKLPKPAHESEYCLNCHSPATSATIFQQQESNGPRRADRPVAALVRDLDRMPRDGVDCEQCHGPAERWLIPHVRADWKKRSDKDRQALGFNNLNDILTRANVCADCHVGRADPAAIKRDVNHDAIAAGHPRLFFELSTFHANWPKHWPDDTDAKRHPVAADQATTNSNASLFEAKLWAIGQVVTAKRSLWLLTARTQDRRAWPELAEWNCFACHHDLRSASWWQFKDEAKRPRGSFGWNAWPYAMLEPLARQTRGPDLSAAEAPFSKLHAYFTSPLPPAREVQLAASAAGVPLRTWAAQLNRVESSQELLAPESLAALRKTLVEDTGRRLVGRDWDSATQLFLSLNALQSAIIAARSSSTEEDHERDRQIQAVLDSMNETLNFQPGLRSPHEFSAQPIDRLRSGLQKLQKLLSTP